MHIAHINIRASRELLDSEKSFFCKVFRLTEGFRPDFQRHGYWLYSGEHALIHLTECDIPRSTNNTGHLDHIAFAMSGLDEFITALESLAVIYSLNKIPDLSITQVFFKSPSGIGLEANFSDDNLSLK